MLDQSTAEAEASCTTTNSSASRDGGDVCHKVGDEHSTHMDAARASHGSNPSDDDIAAEQRQESSPSETFKSLEEGYAGGATFRGGQTMTVTKSEGGYIYIEFGEHDKGDPMNWSRGRKFATLFCTFLFATLTAINATGYSSVQRQVMDEFGVSETVFLLGNTLYLSVGIAFTPLLLAPLSEIFGRLPIFLASAMLFSLLYIAQALTPNITGLLIARFFQGCVASVGNSMTGGTVSDIYKSSDRGIPMSFFALLIYVGQSIGPSAVSYTVANPSLGWRWAFGWQGIVGGGVSVIMLLVLRETRGPVLLSRRAQKLTRDDPNGRMYRCSADDERVAFFPAVKISLARPAWWLISEPIVTSFSLWIGFLWGSIFILLEGVPFVFEGYGWTAQQTSLVFYSLAVGGAIAWALNFYNEKLYARAVRKHAPEKPPAEARLYFACLGGCLAPVGFFIFAWTGRPGISPVGPIIGLVVFVVGTFWIYLAVFTHIAHVYELYASSGLAAQSWLRNVLAGVFPLFAPAMYRNLTPPIASTVLGVIATVLGACPFLLYFYGPALRQRSRVAQALIRAEEERRVKMDRERERNSQRQRRQEAREARKRAVIDAV